MKNQVLSIAQMQHLQELGLDTGDASMYWKRVSHGSRIDDKSKGKWFLSLQKEFQTCGFMSYETLPAYTLQDILDKLPTLIIISSDFIRFALNRLVDIGIYITINLMLQNLSRKSLKILLMWLTICCVGVLKMDILKRRVNNGSTCNET